jgi:CBS domain-containing protein
MPTFETLGSVLNRKGRALYSVRPDAPVIDALTLMAKKGVAAILVISDGVALGIVSAKDYGRRIVLEGRSSTLVRVEEIMSRSLITIDVDADAALGIAIMTQHHIRHLPVMEGGKLAGVVSMGDLASAIIADQAFTIDHLKKYVGHA